MKEELLFKKFNRKYFRVSCILILFTIVSLFLVGFIHESAHKVIFGYYGLDSKIHLFSHFPNAVTIAEGPCPSEFCQLAQSNVDAFGYPIISLIVVGLIIFSMVYLRSVGNEFDEEIRFIQLKELLENGNN